MEVRISRRTNVRMLGCKNIWKYEYRDVLMYEFWDVRIYGSTNIETY